MPLLLSRFGTTDINLWYLYAAVLSLQMVLDAGFGSAFVRVIAYGTVGLNDFSGLRASSTAVSSTGEFSESFVATTYRLMLDVYRVLGLVALGTLGLFGTWVFRLPILESSDPSAGWLCWGFFALTFPVILWGNVYINLLQGTHNVALVRRWDTLFNLFNSVSTIGVMLFVPNVYLLLLLSQSWMLAATLRNYYLVRQKYPFLQTTPADESEKSEIKKNLIPSALKSGVGILMSQGIIQGSAFVYAQLASPAALASYLIGLNLIQLIRNFAQAPFYSRLPELASYTGKGDIERLKAVARKNMFRVYAIYTLGFFAVTLFHRPIFQLIHSNVAFPDPLLWGLLGLAFLMDRFGAMHLQLYSTTNHIIWHTLNGITGVLMLVLSAVAYRYMGIYAFPFSMLVAYGCCYSWYAPYKSYQFIQENFWTFEKKGVIPFTLILLIYLAFLSA